MRQVELTNPEVFDFVDAPAIAPLIDPPAQHASAAPDLPKAAGILLLVAYGGLLGAFAVTIHGARANFAIVISAFYLAMFFAVPALFFRIENERKRRPDLVQFLDRGIETATGHISGSGALVQMLIVPVLLAFGVVAMGITYLLV